MASETHLRICSPQNYTVAKVAIRLQFKPVSHTASGNPAYHAALFSSLSLTAQGLCKIRPRLSAPRKAGQSGRGRSHFWGEAGSLYSSCSSKEILTSWHNLLKKNKCDIFLARIVH
jgi:hypothetical protein